MKTILKTVLAIGLVASSSLAVAEGKFAYRQPLQGVSAIDNYGLTESEIEQKNIDMCLNESGNGVEFRDWDFDANNGFFIYSTSNVMLSWSGVIHRQKVLPSFSGWDQRATYINENWEEGTAWYYKDGYSYGATNCSSISSSIYDVPLNINPNSCEQVIRWQGDSYRPQAMPTENYEWCVTNGYQTAD